MSPCGSIASYWRPERWGSARAPRAPSRVDATGGGALRLAVAPDGTCGAHVLPAKDRATAPDRGSARASRAAVDAPSTAPTRAIARGPNRRWRLALRLAGRQTVHAGRMCFPRGLERIKFHSTEPGVADGGITSNERKVQDFCCGGNDAVKRVAREILG